MKFSGFIQKMQEEISPEIDISEESTRLIDYIVNRLCDRMTDQSLKLMRPLNLKTMQPLPARKTLTSREVQTTARLLMGSELAKHAVSEGTKAVVKFTDPENKKATSTERAGLIFPVPKIEASIRSSLPKDTQLSKAAVVYQTAVLEYICAELLELSRDACIKEQADAICMEHVKLAVVSDDELKNLLYASLHLVLPGSRDGDNKKIWNPDMIV